MFHLETFSSSLSTGTANAFQQLTFVSADAVLQKLVNGMQVSQALPKLMAVMGVGSHLVHVRAQAPSMLPTPYVTLSPNNRGGAFASPPRIWDFSGTPIPLRLTEEFDIFATQNSGGAEVEYVSCLFTDGFRTPPPPVRTAPSINGDGSFFTLHGTATTTLTAGAWTNIPASGFTFDQPLPAGLYSLVGMRVFSATGLFFRMFPQVAPLWRPGGIAVQAYDQMDPFNQRFLPEYGPVGFGWGEWLRFYSNTPPGIEVFATSADTAEEVFMDIIKVSDATIQGTM
jgi:hypothetical protein